MAAAIFYPREIDKLINLSIEHLIEEYREIASFSGWHQQLGSNKIGNIANAQGLLMLSYFNKEFSNKYKVIETLRRTQFTENKIELLGGWAFATNYSKAPSCDCTSWVLLSLMNELPITDETIQNGIKWLSNNTSIKTPNSGWGCIKDDAPRTYATCLALRVYAKANLKNTESFKNGVRWLKESQNHDGGWGEDNNTQSTITHTAHAVETLINSGISKNSPTIKKGINFVISNYSEDRTWINDSNAGLLEFVDIDIPGTEPQRVSYYHFSLAWAIIASIKAETLNDKAGNALNKLIGSQDNGNWKHPYLNCEKHYTIYTKHDALYALKTFKDCFNANWNNSKKIKISNNNIQTFTKELNPLQLAFRDIYKKIFTWIIIAIIPILSYILYKRQVIEYKDIWLVVVFPILIVLISNFGQEKRKNSL